MDIQTQDLRKHFRRRISFLSGTMIMFVLLMNALFVVQATLCELLSPFLGEIGYDVFYSLTYGISYFLSFFIPSVILHFALKEDVYPEGYKAARTSKGVGLWILLTLGAVYCCALLNSYLMNFFFNFIGQPDTELFETEFNGIHSILLEVLTMSLVPGLCEEILFRGVFLKKLLPFGKNLAVVLSALFFALMHQMPMQFFYTFSAGLMLGYLYVYTGSIWWGVVVHMLNNFLSVMTSVFDYYFPEKTATVLDTLTYAVLAVAAVVSLIVLVRDRKRTFRPRESVFGKTVPLPFVDGPCKMDRGMAVRNFFTPTTIVFLCIYFLTTLLNFVALYIV